MADAHSTARARRRVAIEALGRELDADPASSASRLAAMLDEARPLAVSGDIDGLVSAAMLGSVSPDFEIVAFSLKSADWLVHPSVVAAQPDSLLEIDLFSTHHDNVSNHVVLWGDKRVRVEQVRDAFATWDEAVLTASNRRLLAVPSVWARTQGGREGKDIPTSAAYKYPLGTAQILLAMLEAAGRPPKFFDRTYLPWLVANCDGGVETYRRYADNARVWWPVMAGAVGPGSLTEQIFRMVDEMRPHDFLDAVHRLAREQGSSRLPLNDQWNLTHPSPEAIKCTLRWLTELTGWRDPVRGGIDGLDSWAARPPDGWARVPIGEFGKLTEPELLETVGRIRGADGALNANFYHGGPSGSRFNWIGGW